MNADQLLKASSVHRTAGETDTAIDSAVWAYAVAADDQQRTAAALGAALGFLDSGMPADALLFSERALDGAPGHRGALAARGLAHRGLGQVDRALSDLDAAVAPADRLPGAVPRRARLARALVLGDIGRRVEGIRELDATLRAPADEDGDELTRLAHRTRGLWRLVDGDLPGAVKDLTAAVRLGDRRSLAHLLEVSELPDDPEVLLTRMVALRMADQVVEAATVGERLLAGVDLPARVLARARLNMGLLAVAEGTVHSAVDWMALAVEADGTDAEVLTAYGRILASVGRTDEAVTALLRAVEIGAEHPDGRAETYLGDLHGHVGRPDLAAEWYQRALRIVPCDPAARFGCGLALIATGRDEEGVGLIRRAGVAGHPDAVEWCNTNDVTLPAERMETASWLSKSMGNRDSARVVLYEAAQAWLEYSNGPGDTAARHAAVALVDAVACEVELAEPEAGERTARAAIDLHPSSAAAWQALGSALVASGRLQEAIEAYDRCLWCDPRRAAAHDGRAEALCRLGAVDRAVIELNLAVTVGADDQPARQQERIATRSRLHRALGRWDLACVDFELLAEGGVYDRDEVDEWLRGARAVDTVVGGGTRGYSPPPYRWYGLARDDWDGYGGIDWSVRLQFDVEPDDAARVRIATTVGEQLHSTGDLVATLLWSGRFALLRVRAGDVGGGSPHWQLVRAIAEAHQAQHLVEVVNFAAQGAAVETDLAEAWSVATSPAPDPGPDFGASLAFWIPAQAADGKFAEPFCDPDADAALLAAITRPPAGPAPADGRAATAGAGPAAGSATLAGAGSAARAGTPGPAWSGPTTRHPAAADGMMADGRAADGMANDGRAADGMAAGPTAIDLAADPATGLAIGLSTGPEFDRAAVRAGTDVQITMVMIEQDELPPRPPPARDMIGLRRDRFDVGKFAANGAGVVIRRPDGMSAGLDRVTAEGDVHEVIAVGLDRQADGHWIDAVSVSPDGTLAMFTMGAARELYLLDIATGGTAVLLEDVPRVESTAFVDPVQIMVKTAAWLAIFVLTPEGPATLARDFTPAGPATVCADGRLIITSAVREPELVVYGLADGVLGRLAELSAPVNCYRVWTNGDRAFAADRSMFEIVGMLPAWQRFAAWAAGLSDPGDEGGLVVEELDDAPYTGINDGLDEIRDVAVWCVRGPAGLLLAVRPVDGGSQVLVGDGTGVRAVDPPLLGVGFEYDWRPDGRALLVRDQGTGDVAEVDVGQASAVRVATEADQACYTATGFAVLRGEEIFLYAWPHGGPDEPVELARYPVAPGATTLGWADGGRVLHLTAEGRTGFYVVGGGALYPIGAFPGQEWFSGWNLDGVLFFANCHSGRNFRAYRVTGFNPAVVEALGRESVGRVFPAELPSVRYVERTAYPGTTRWRYFQDG